MCWISEIVYIGFFCGVVMVGVRQVFAVASAISVIQLVLGLYFSYSVRVAGDVSTPLMLLPLHLLLAIMLFALLVFGVVRGRGGVAPRIAFIPLALLVVSGLVGMSISLTIQGVLRLDPNLLSALGLYIHNPLGWFIVVTTTLTYIKSRKG